MALGLPGSVAADCPASVPRAKKKGLAAKLTPCFVLAGGRGFEPRLAESESAVLPLDDPPREARMIAVAARSCQTAGALRLVFVVRCKKGVVKMLQSVRSGAIVSFVVLETLLSRRSLVMKNGRH